MPCGDEAGPEEEVVGSTVDCKAGPLVVDGEGVVFGGATGVSATLAMGALAASSVFAGSGLAVFACSADKGGASRSSSRAADGVPPAGLIKPAGLPLSERRLIRGFSEVGLAKLNSPAVASGSE